MSGYLRKRVRQHRVTTMWFYPLTLAAICLAIGAIIFLVLLLTPSNDGPPAQQGNAAATASCQNDSADTACLLSALSHQYPELQQIMAMNRYHVLNMSQTVGEYTVTIVGAYADANRIEVVYTMSGPPARAGKRILPVIDSLTDDQGASLRTKGTGGMSIQNDLQAGVGLFDADTLQNAPAVLSLHLRLSLQQDGGSTRGVPDQLAPSVPTMAQRAGMQPVAPPFIFDFRTPFNGGDVTTPQQEVNAAGVTITLARMVTSPLETQTTLCFTTPDGKADWSMSATLDDQRGVGIGPVSSAFGNQNCVRYSFLNKEASLPDVRNLTVTELLARDPHTRLTGPWVFTLHVP